MVGLSKSVKNWIFCAAEPSDTEDWRLRLMDHGSDAVTAERGAATNNQAGGFNVAADQCKFGEV